MDPKRKKVQDFLLKYVKETHPSTYELMKIKFDGMSDTDFKKYMQDLKFGRDKVNFIVSPDEKKVPSVRHLSSVLNKLGVNHFQRLIEHSKEFGKYKSPIETALFVLYCKRPIQSLDKKISIPTGNKIDPLTGQPTGESRSSKLTIPEVQVWRGNGVDKTIKEFLNDRGGDSGAGRAFDTLLFQNGKVTFKELDKFSTGVTSTKTLKSYWLASHIKSTL